jgi:RNA polymerase sigma-70 factor (ECF subfamily)
MLATEMLQAAMAGEDVLAALLARTAAGDEKAFRALYERSAGRLFAIVLRIARDHATAEGVLEQTYARIFERACAFDPAHDALAWMIAIARAQAIEAVRARPRELSLQAQDLRMLDDPLASPAARRCFAEIAEPARRAVLLAYREGLTYEELAAVFGVPAGMAREWVCKALTQMRQCLDVADEQA